MRVLLVEDEPMLAETITAGLRAEGFVVVAVADGAEAIERLLAETCVLFGDLNDLAANI